MKRTRSPLMIILITQSIHSIYLVHLQARLGSMQMHYVTTLGKLASARTRASSLRRLAVSFASYA
jgi:hypothetical protein